MPSFPATIATDADLLVALDNAETALAAGIGSGDTSLSVVSGAAIATNVVVTIDSEMIFLGAVAGVNATSLTRGYGGTTPAGHSSGAAVKANVIAKHHNAIKDEVKAIQTSLGAGLISMGVRAAVYAWSLAGPVNLTGGVPTVISLSPFPSGITAAGIALGHYVLIADSLGGYESVLISAINPGVSITITPVSNHTAANYSIGSANGGIQEAIYATTANTIHVKDGVTIMYRGIACGQRRLTFAGAGHNSSYIRMAFPTQAGFYSDAFGFQFRDLTIKAYGAASGTATHAASGVLAYAAGSQWGAEIVGRQFTYNGVSVICTAFNSATSITVSPVPAVVVLPAAWSATAQSAGKAAHLTGSTVYPNGDGDLAATGCEFYGLYDVFYGDWPGGFIRLTNNMFRGIVRYAAYGKGTSAWACQYIGNYLDGRDSPGLFWIEGTLGGGIIADNWMQASLAHIVLNGVTGAINETLIVGNILDQDTAATACVVINNSANCIRIAENFIAGFDIGVLAQAAENVMIVNNRFRVRGNDAGIVIGGATADRISVQGNDLQCEGNAMNYAIQVSPTAGSNITVKGNTGDGTASVSAFIGVIGAFTGLTIDSNTPGLNYAKLINDVGVTGGGEVACFANRARNIPAITLASAETITLPLADETQVIALTGTTTIRAMIGVSARAGSKRIFVMGGALSWALPSSISITSATNANPVVFTVAAGHGFATGEGPVITISGGTGAWTVVNGSFVATILSPTTFSIAVNSTAIGAVAGTIVYVRSSNSIGRAFGPTVAGQIVQMIKYSDNIWYPL